MKNSAHPYQGRFNNSRGQRSNTKIRRAVKPISVRRLEALLKPPPKGAGDDAK